MVIHYFHDREVGFTRWFSILRFPRCREVGYIQRLYIISTAVRSGHRRFILIIITTAPFEVEGREVGCSTVYEVYMVRFMMSIWYGI